ncbi:hypothetical protein PL78_12835 [Yersinia entomophaga]|uniref:Uncharacterized protein n=1 Tax=Yersinia entomophaga TaxID=935293 RepID=A0ABN4PUS6_YERET|nr:fimbria/pilus outer membrane usher protein [Yersinia entomophaga]ANI30703.1 hypothetical protein PL78_12835 [Yersinia entomophaga]OWF85616.1 hypothetical protein B4914_16875 [Yersinia entomophaga]
MKPKKNSIRLFLYFSIFLISVRSLADDGVEFDIGILEERGVSASAADYFKYKARFSSGDHSIELTINGVARGWVDMTFNQQGEPCFSPDFYQKSGIIPPPMENGCSDLRLHYPRALVNLFPSTSRIEVILPAELLQVGEVVTGNYETGGSALLMNYDALAIRNQNGSNNLQASTEAGFNSGNWIFRSRQIFSYKDRRQQWSRLYSYLQRTFIEKKTTLQMGEINLNSGLFSTPQIYGLQIMPESALASREGSGATVSGIAPTQSSVEIRQRGALIYVTQLPPGPFTLTQIPINSTGADLLVSVIGVDGQTQSFSVPAASFNLQYVPRTRGIYAGMGRTGPGSNQHQESWLGTLTDVRPLGDLSDITQGVLLGSRYHSAGLAVNTGLIPRTFWAVNAVTSWDRQNEKQGVQWGSHVGVKLVSSLKLNLSTMHRTAGFRQFQHSLRERPVAELPAVEPKNKNPNADKSGVKNQYRAQLSYSQSLLGGISLGYTQSVSFAKQQERRWSLGWNKQLPYNINFNLNMERNLNSKGDKIIYGNISIPLNSNMSLSSTVSQSRGRTQQRVGLNHQVNNQLGYSLGVSQTANQSGQALSGTLRVLPKYAQLGVGYFQDSARNSSYQLQASGGVAVHSAGVTLSPYAIQDTFAVIALPGISGAEIQTNSGPVWTDRRGYALAPSLSPFSSSRLEVNTKKLARNIDIKNGIRLVDASRGAVLNYNFKANKTRRILLSIRLASGEYAAEGSDITDKEDNYVGTVGSKGTLLLSNSDGNPDLYIKDNENEICQLDYSLPEAKDAPVLYEEADARCL